MNARTTTTLAAAIFLMTVLQLVAALVNGWAALGCALALAPFAFGIFHFFDVELPARWIKIGAPVLASVVGLVIAYFASNPDPRFLLAPFGVAAAAALIDWFQNRDARRCALCNRRISGVAFDCPRCGLLVCEQNCWSFDHCRCRLCEQNRVPVFSPDGRWWDRQFGPRSSYGRCQLCMTVAEETDLRVCGKCGRPQCRDCWDFSNGQCGRCHWIVEDLPEALRPYVVAAPAGGSERSGRY